jgi:hypothetical protein
MEYINSKSLFIDSNKAQVRIGSKSNLISGLNSSILGGINNAAIADNTFVIGNQLTATVANVVYVNNLSAQTSILGPDSINWNSVYSYTNTNSAFDQASRSFVNANSAEILNSYNATSWVFANTAREIAVSTVVNNTSANWNSVYSYTNTNSSFDQASRSFVNTNSAEILNSYNATSWVFSNSAREMAVSTVVNNTSANWNSVYTYTNTNSSFDQAARSFVNRNSAEILNSYNATSWVFANTAREIAVSTVVNNTSANWNSVYSYTNSNSSFDQASRSFVNRNSAEILNSYNATSWVFSNSAREIAVSTVVNNTSANWNNAYNTGTVYQSNSATYATILFANNKFLPLSGGTLNGTLYIAGNLFVTGTASYINVQDFQVVDPLIYLGVQNPSDLLDIGFTGVYRISGDAANHRHTGLIRNHQDKKWILFSNLSACPLSSLTYNPDLNNPSIVIDTLRANIEGNLTTNTTVSGQLNVLNNIFSTNTIYDSNGNSNQWNSVYTYTNTNSSFDQAARSWVNSNSAREIAVSTVVNNTSANWNSVYSNVNSNSATYATILFANNKFLPLSGGQITGNLSVSSGFNVIGDATINGNVSATKTIYSNELDFGSLERPSLTGIKQALNSFLYVSPSLSYLRINGSSSQTLEVGQSLTSPVLTWTSNKIEPQAVSNYLLTLPNANFTFGTNTFTFSSFNDPNTYNITTIGGTATQQTSSWSVRVTDWAGAQSTSNVSANWRYRVYYGKTNQANPNSAQILASTEDSTLATSRLGLGEKTVTPSNQYFFVAYPVRFGTTSQLKVNGLNNTDLTQISIVSFTNAYGGTADYYVYRSNSLLTSTYTIEII